MRRWSRHKGDTIDFLERGVAGFDQGKGGLPQRHGACRSRGLLEFSWHLARDDELSQVVAHHEQLADRLAPHVTGAAAAGAAATAHEAVRPQIFSSDLR